MNYDGRVSLSAFLQCEREQKINCNSSNFSGTKAKWEKCDEKHTHTYTNITQRIFIGYMINECVRFALQAYVM